MRCTKRKPEDEGEGENAQKESEHKNANMAIDVPADEEEYDGQELDPETVKKARALQMEWYRKMNVYEKRPIEECFDKTTRPPIKVKWVDHSRGDRHNVNVRSRLLTKQINTGKEEGLFTATAPLEALQMLLSATVTGNKPKALMFNRHKPSVHARTDGQ